MADPATIGLILTGISTAVQAASTLVAGKAEQAAGRARQQALEHQAAQARQIAGQERAASQRAAFEKRREGRLLSSRALARAAASGAGAGDPTVENILGDIGAEGEFRALTELFLGEERARNLETQAALKIFEGTLERRAGDVARRASRVTAFAQVLGGGAFIATELGKGKGSSATLSAGKGLSTTLSAGKGLPRFGKPRTK